METIDLSLLNRRLVWVVVEKARMGDTWITPFLGFINQFSDDQVYHLQTYHCPPMDEPKTGAPRVAHLGPYLTTNMVDNHITFFGSRSGAVDCIHYFFLDSKAAKRFIMKKKLLECKIYTNYTDHLGNIQQL